MVLIRTARLVVVATPGEPAHEQRTGIGARQVELLGLEQLHRDARMAAEAEDLVARVVHERRRCFIEVKASGALLGQVRPAASGHERPRSNQRPSAGGRLRASLIAPLTTIPPGV